MDLSHSFAQGSRRNSPQRALRPSAWLVGKQCIYLPIYGSRLGSGQSKRQVPEHVFKMFWKDFDKDGRGSVCLSDQVELPGSINSPSCSMARWKSPQGKTKSPNINIPTAHDFTSFSPWGPKAESKPFAAAKTVLQLVLFSEDFHGLLQVVPEDSQRKHLVLKVNRLSPLD